MSALHLKRIRVQQFRQFRDAFEASGLPPGLTVLHGPQEAGKSTIATAIRAAFLERCGSAVHTDFQPYGESGAAPTVELDFEFQDRAHALKKTFVKQTRCDLAIGNERYDSTAAEDRLADLFGFSFAGKGKNRAENLGIPGLLWVEQGGHEVADSITHGATHLRGSLQRELAELTSSTGDALIERVTRERAELLTDSGAVRKNSALQQAVEREAKVAADVEDLTARVTQYQADVDRYAHVVPELDAMQSAKPWETMRAKYDQAAWELAQASQLQEQLVRAEEEVGRAHRHLEGTRDQLKASDLKKQDLADLALAVQQAVDELAELEARATEAADRLQAAELERSAASEMRTQATDAAARKALEDRREQERANRDRAVRLHERAEELSRQVKALRERAAATAIDPESVARLGEVEAERHVLEAKLQSTATRLAYALGDGGRIQVGDDELTGAGERLLTAATDVEIPGVGRLEITPGGSADLGVKRAELKELRAERDRLLQAMGVVSHAAALERQDAARQADRSLEQHEALLREVAPSGLDNLRDLVADADRVIDELAQQLQLLPPAPQAELSAEDAAEAADRAAVRHTAAAVAATAAESAARHHRTDLARRQEQLEQLRKAVESADYVARREALVQAIATGQAELEERERQHKELSEQVAALDLESLGLQVQRFKNAEDQTRGQLRDLTRERDRLEGNLQAGDAFGLEEQLAQAKSDLAVAGRRRTELRQRADALAHLLERLQAHRAELTRKLTEPLTRAIQPYLDILMPGTGAWLEIDELLVPRRLVRATGPAAGSTVFEELSHGTQEQLSVVVRLAYAALLAEQGHPAMVMLDDQLVHSDDARFEKMKQVILRASRTHQILVFTCHPDRWRDAGAPMVDIRTA